MIALIIATIVAGAIFAAADFYFKKTMIAQAKKLASGNKLSLNGAYCGFLSVIAWIAIVAYLVHTIATDEVISWPNVEGAVVYLFGTHVVRFIFGKFLGNLNFNS